MRKGSSVGLFDLFKKEKPEKEDSTIVEEDLELYSGMRVEVTEATGRLLFVAKLMGVHGYTAELHQYSEAEISPETETLSVRIRGYSDREKKAVYLEGNITPRPNHIWNVENLTVARVGNDRAFFRLDTNIDAAITTFSGLGAGERPCKLLNISVGGAGIGSDQQYHQGDKFMLKVKLLEDRAPSIMYCQVLRVIERDGGKYEYGCKFLELTEADQEKIIQNIFAVQRMKRGGSVK